MSEHGAKVVVVDGGYDHYDAERAILAPLGAELVVAPCEGDSERVVDVAHDADAVLVRETPLPASTLERLPRCRVIVRYGVGTDNIDLAYAADHGIQVANVPDYGVEEVSEHAVALLLAVKRRLFERDAAVREGRWGDVAKTPIHRTRGTVLGLIGAGRIGGAFIAKARPLGFGRVLVHARDRLPEGTEPAEIDRICREADVISLHVPLTDSTRNIIDERRLGLMKPTTILINTARGGLIDETALAEALAAGRLRGAGLDVFAEEPLPAGSPLRKAPNCILTDHSAWFSEEAVQDLQRKAAEEVRRGLTGEPLVNPVRPGR
ncbi:C-terminal binding protein [Amorphus orientalis]|uniref:D-3-phosphoglycerate dehydrogenase n=1 Tax=Amorphus orientalis TaxID=649198 RepID=A0AAE3VM71_9HYPH|nr:C-terminal binding protein [Amorphus orientalis]MDQ0314525.1 D-3-phosphoglycerate dehydrogenase [Amorphus orientalis]